MWLKTRILCIDDGVRNDWGKFLEPCCYEIVRAANLNEGLTLARSSFFHLYLICQPAFEDLTKEFSRKIRSFDQNTPILHVLESAARPEIRVSDTTQEHIHKSVQPHDLEEAIVRLISNAELKRQLRLKTAQPVAAGGKRSETPLVFRTVA